MSMVFCRGCGKEIHETAPTCPHCGAPQGIVPKQDKLAYASYDQVPWYRKNWFALLCGIFFTPPLLIVLLTGNAYYVRKGQLRTYSIAARIILILYTSIASVYTFSVAWQMINGKTAIPSLTTDTTVQMVKNGSMQICPGTTTGKFIDDFLSNPSWESGVSDDGRHFVNVDGGITYAGKDANAKIQFIVNHDNNTYKYNALEINDLPQNELMAMALLNKMCNSANKANPSTKNSLSNRSTDKTTINDGKAPPVDPVIGTWKNKYQSLTINSFDGGYVASIAIGFPNSDGSFPGCGGGAKGIATIDGNTLKFSEQDDGLKKCSVEVHFHENNASVSEDGCGDYHGYSCEFDGTYIKSTSSATNQTPEQTTASQQPTSISPPTEKDDKGQVTGTWEDSDHSIELSINSGIGLIQLHPHKNNCTGGMSGRILPNGNDLTFSDDGDGTKTCTINVHFSGNTAETTESIGCEGGFRMPTPCSFSGTLTKSQ